MLIKRGYPSWEATLCPYWSWNLMLFQNAYQVICWQKQQFRTILSHDFTIFFPNIILPTLMKHFFLEVTIHLLFHHSQTQWLCCVIVRIPSKSKVSISCMATACKSHLIKQWVLLYYWYHRVVNMLHSVNYYFRISRI